MSADYSFPISKMDAARAQLQTAIYLMLTNGDILSIHTLACAAYGILEDLNRHVGGKPMFKDCYGEIPELAKKWRNWVSTPQNYLKHADRDHEVALRFRPEVTGIVLMEATKALLDAGCEHTPIIRAYNIWMSAMTPNDLFATNYDVPAKDREIAKIVRTCFGPADQVKFYDHLCTNDFDFSRAFTPA